MSGDAKKRPSARRARTAKPEQAADAGSEKKAAKRKVSARRPAGTEEAARPRRKAARGSAGKAARAKSEGQSASDGVTTPKKRASARRTETPRARESGADRESVDAPRDAAKRTPKVRRPQEPAASEAPRETPPDAEAPDPLHELEETVDRLIQEADSIAGDPHARRRAAEALSELATRLGGYEERAPGAEETGLIDSARELLSTDYYVRRWGRLAMRHRSEEVDDFGLDRTYEGRVAPLFEALYRRWFRVTVRGAEHVPAEGRAMIVANHGGALPWDGLMVRTALRLEHPARREARWLTEDFVYHMPFLGPFLTRVGAVRACPENAERLLDQDALLTVFPEGIKGIGKLYRDRYRLQRFGRGGYAKLALRTGTPIVPAGIVGSEEAYPLLVQSTLLAKLVGVPFLPVTPTFPWLGPLGLVPLPSRWVMVFGEPITFDEHGPEAAQDALLVNRLNDEVRARVQELVEDALGARDAAYL